MILAPLRNKVETVLLTDTHCHVWQADSQLHRSRHYTPPPQALLEHLFEQWKSHGIQRGVLVQPSFLDDGHGALQAALISNPSRLRGVAAFDFPPSANEVSQLHHLGFRGTRFNLIGGRELSIGEMHDWIPAFAAMRDLNWHLVIAASGQALARAIHMLEPHGLAVVVDHFGLPSQRRVRDCPGIAAIKNSSLRCYMKLSAWYRTDHPKLDLVQQLAQEKLLQHCIWGSDWPFTRFHEIDMEQVVSAVVELLCACQVSEADLEANAQELYFSE